MHFILPCRRYVLWMRGNKQLSKFLQKNRFIYPFLVSFFVSALTFPGGLGVFMSADVRLTLLLVLLVLLVILLLLLFPPHQVSTHDQIHALFSNYTWAQVCTLLWYMQCCDCNSHCEFSLACEYILSKSFALYTLGRRKLTLSSKVVKKPIKVVNFGM